MVFKSGPTYQTGLTEHGIDSRKTVSSTIKPLV